MELLSILQYSFIQKALIAGSCVAVVCSTLGVFLVLRRMSLIGDGLSHVSFGAIACGLFFGIYPIYIAIPLVMLASVFVLKISGKAKLYGDAAIGIVSSVGIACGVLLASLSKGFNVDLFSYLFGNILAINNTETILSIGLVILIFIIIILFYWDLFSVTFDEEFSKTIGVKTDSLNTMLALLTAITVVLAVRTVGVMLVSALLILPAVSALQIAKNLKSTLFLSSIFSLFSLIVGIMISFVLDLPAGATIVLLNALILLLSLCYKKLSI